VSASSPVDEKNAAECDRDEGDIVDRLKAATQAYLEWMPLRAGPGTMGVVDLASITQVIEWGSMATIVAFDTRISHRSMAPTLAGSSK
jgi:phosphodiesterase/alkaline phosphatase D-like protein